MGGNSSTMQPANIFPITFYDRAHMPDIIIRINYDYDITNDYPHYLNITKYTWVGTENYSSQIETIRAKTWEELYELYLVKKREYIRLIGIAQTGDEFYTFYQRSRTDKINYKINEHSENIRQENLEQEEAQELRKKSAWVMYAIMRSGPSRRR